MGPDVSEAVYVCLEEAGPMFGHLYGLGSFLASPRGATVASELEVLSLVAHAVGEKSQGKRAPSLTGEKAPETDGGDVDLVRD